MPESEHSVMVIDLNPVKLTNSITGSTVATSASHCLLKDDETYLDQKDELRGL
jgi:hypothetical protein